MLFTLQNRLNAVRQLFDQWKVDGILIENPINRRWLSGFTGSEGTLLITAKKAILMTDFRYWERVKQESSQLTLFKKIRGEVDIKELMAEYPLARVGVEASHTTLATAYQYQQIKTIKWVPLHQTIEPLRQSKTIEEIASIKRAALFADDTMRYFSQIAHPGMTEKTLAWLLEKYMRELGADDKAFPIIVAAGANAAFAHHAPSDYILKEGDMVIVDLGAQVDGYHSDITRTFYLGDEPTNRFWEVYNIVSRAHEKGVETLHAGITGQEVDQQARAVIEREGYGENFGHGLGHGVGLAVHEDPKVSKVGNTTIPTGSVVTIEPGIYIPDWGGVRIEDLMYVKDNGVEYLTHCSKEPFISGT